MRVLLFIFCCTFAVTHSPSSLQAGNDIALSAEEDLTITGSHVIAEHDATLTAGDDITIQAAQEQYSDESWNANLSVSLGLYGDNAGQLSVSAGGGMHEASGTTHHNSTVSAGEHLTIEAGNDLTIAGGNVHGGTADIIVGDDLSVISLQDTSHTSGFQLGVSGGDNPAEQASVSGGNASITTGDSDWVGDQSSLTAEGALNVSVGDHTQLTGGIIHSDSNELTLETESLGHEDLQDHQDLLHLGAGGTIRPDDPESAIGNTHTAEFGLTDIQQTTHATLGLGDITIHDDLANGTNSLAGINRDIAQAQVITRHREIETIRAIYTEVNIGNLVNQVGEAGDRYRALMQDIKLDVIDAKLRIADILKGDLKTEADMAMFGALKRDIDAGILTEAEAIKLATTMLDYSIYAAGCNGVASRGFNWKRLNPLNLLVSPVYAASGGCADIGEWLRDYDNEAYLLSLEKPDEHPFTFLSKYYVAFCSNVEEVALELEQKRDDAAALASTLGDFVPVVGDVKGVYDALNCDSISCGIITAGGVIVGIIPFVGDAAGSGIRGLGDIPWGTWNDYSKVRINGQEYAQVGNRLYTRHAVDRMQPRGLGTPAGGTGPGRSISPNLVDDVISQGNYIMRKVNGQMRRHYRSGSTQVVTSANGRVVITVNPNRY